MWPNTANSNDRVGGVGAVDDEAKNHGMLSGLLLEVSVVQILPKFIKQIYFGQDAILHNAIHKMQNPIDKMLFLGFIAGLWVGLGGIAGNRKV